MILWVRGAENPAREATLETRSDEKISVNREFVQGYRVAQGLTKVLD